MGLITRFPTSWENGGGSISNATDGYSLDSAYMSVTGDGSRCRYLGFSAYTLPAGYTLTGYRMHVRYYYSAASGIEGSLSFNSGAVSMSLPQNLSPVTRSQSLMGWPLSGLPTNTLAVVGVASDILCVDAVWFEIEFSHAPTTPASITYPSTIHGGDTITVSCAASTDPGSDITGYEFSRSINGGAYSVIGTPATNSISNTVTGNTVRFRARAVDSEGIYSSYVSGSTVTIINNAAPAISGSDSSLGTKSAAFAQDYTVTDADANTVTVTEKIDGVTLRSYTATLGATNTFSVTGDTWITMPNGSHTLTVEAYDGAVTSTRTWTFTKSVTTAQLKLETPLAADAMPTKCICNIQGAWPLGSTLTFEVCNNGNDASPAWEDITTKVLNGQKHFFVNATKTATNWGINMRATLVRGTAEGVCAIQSIGGNFE